MRFGSLALSRFFLGGEINDFGEAAAAPRNHASDNVIARRPPHAQSRLSEAGRIENPSLDDLHELRLVRAATLVFLNQRAIPEARRVQVLRGLVPPLCLLAAVAVDLRSLLRVEPKGSDEARVLGDPTRAPQPSVGPRAQLAEPPIELALEGDGIRRPASQYLDEHRHLLIPRPRHRTAAESSSRESNPQIAVEPPG